MRINVSPSDEVSATATGSALTLLPDLAPAARLSPKLYRVAGALGGAALIAGMVWTPGRAWANLLVAAYGLTTAGLAGLFFIALQYVTGATWSVVLRRIPEALTGALWVGIPLLWAVIVFQPSLWEWTRPEHHLGGFKGWWLNPGFFLGRCIGYGAVWLAFAAAMVKHSRAQDRDGDPSHTRANLRLSAGFMVVFALTFWLASTDWIMTLEPGWYSTIFGVYNFAGMFNSGLALISVFTIVQTNRGSLRALVTGEHLHDLGKLLFAFSVFWMYIWFSQYMLIWYANLPEEAVYFTRRTRGAWGSLTLLNVFLNWVVPFLALMSSRTKRNPAILLKVSLAVLAGRWLDLFLMVAPACNPAGPRFGVAELGALLGTVSVTALLMNRGWLRAPAVPIRDPGLIESLHFHQ